jgi:hypothetical protein
MLLSHSSAGFAGRSIDGEELDAIVRSLYPLIMACPGLAVWYIFSFWSLLPVDVYPR